MEIPFKIKALELAQKILAITPEQFYFALKEKEGVADGCFFQLPGTLTTDQLIEIGKAIEESGLKGKIEKGRFNTELALGECVNELYR